MQELEKKKKESEGTWSEMDQVSRGRRGQTFFERSMSIVLQYLSTEERKGWT